MFRHYFRQDRKSLLPFTLIGGALGYLGFRYLTQPGEAYKAFPVELPFRHPHPALPRFFTQPSAIRYSGEGCQLKAPVKSLEPTRLLDATCWGAPRVTNADQTISELDALNAAEWPTFLEQVSGDVTVTFGHRKAFDAKSKWNFTHAVVYVADMKGNHAIYGYDYHDHQLLNDSANTTALRAYTLYHELTIKGTSQQATTLMQRMTEFAKDPYNGIGCNCYSPIIAGFIEAKAMGFTVPHAFEKSLLVVIPGEQNYGFGIVPNRYLRPFRQEAIAKINEFKEYVNKKQDEFKQYFKPNK